MFERAFRFVGLLTTSIIMRCFLLTPTQLAAVSLRRYSGKPCSESGMGYHDAQVSIGQCEVSADDACGDNHPHDDVRWPTHCACGYAFNEEDAWQRNVHVLYCRSDTSEQVTLRNAPVGAMWFADWYSDVPAYAGPDGRTLVVRLPGKHDWIVDSRASNCDSPCALCGKAYHQHTGGLCAPLPAGTPYDRDKHYYRDARPHKCWVRHGEAPDIHVDKNGVTCGAGAGSIAIPGYHGFLHNGHLTDC